jgi:uncharacterized membrane protein
MERAMKLATATLLGCGAALLLLGIVIWITDAEELIGLHELIGYVLIASLWTICVVAARSGAPTGTVAFAAIWGLVVLALGLTQEELVTGSWHWTIQVLHVLVSMSALGLGRHLAHVVRRAQPAPAVNHPMGAARTPAQGRR